MMIGEARRNSNKYPNAQLETSLHFDKFFSEKANTRKQHQMLLAQARLQANKH